jgi:hypothetical protein
MFDRMVKGIDTDSKYKRKKIGFWELHEDMYDNKRAVESYCHREGTRREQEEEKTRKKKK